MSITQEPIRGSQEKETNFDEEFAKLRAKIILAGSQKKLIVPSYEEMVGVYLLERDDQLPSRKEPKT